MAQFVAFHPDMEIAGTAITAFVKVFTDPARKGYEVRKKIFDEFGFENPNPQQWYKLQGFLDAFKEVAATLGEMNLFLMGKIAATVVNPPFKSLKEALSFADVAYHSVHRLPDQALINSATGELVNGYGRTVLLDFDEQARKAVVLSESPYPSKFAEGMIAEVLYKYKPADSAFADVKIDLTKERRSEGGKSCTFLLSW